MTKILERGKNERGVIEMVDTESLVPPGHLLRQVDAAVDFEKIYKIVEPLYSEEEGRRSIDPVVLFKKVLLQHLDGNASLRGTLRRAETDIAYRWFLRYTLSEKLLAEVNADREAHGKKPLRTFPSPILTFIYTAFCGLSTFLWTTRFSASWTEAS